MHYNDCKTEMIYAVIYLEKVSDYYSHNTIYDREFLEPSYSFFQGFKSHPHPPFMNILCIKSTH